MIPLRRPARRSYGLAAARPPRPGPLQPFAYLHLALPSGQDPAPLPPSLLVNTDVRLPGRLGAGRPLGAAARARNQSCGRPGRRWPSAASDSHPSPSCVRLGARTRVPPWWRGRGGGATAAPASAPMFAHCMFNTVGLSARRSNGLAAACPPPSRPEQIAFRAYPHRPCDPLPPPRPCLLNTAGRKVCLAWKWEGVRQGLV